MLDSTKSFYFGVATDRPQSDREKKPERPHFAINDIVYYYAPGDNRGKVSIVKDFSRDKNGRILVSLVLTSTGEEVKTTQNHVRQ